MTELWEHPSRRATSVIEAPAFTRSTARRRRRSSSSGLPCGLIPEQYTCPTRMSITYAQVNKVPIVVLIGRRPSQRRRGCTSRRSPASAELRARFDILGRVRQSHTRRLTPRARSPLARGRTERSYEGGGEWLNDSHSPLFRGSAGAPARCRRSRARPRKRGPVGPHGGFLRIRS